MWVRFTEIINYGGKEIPLYFIQESNDPMKPAFNVFVVNDQALSFKVLKEGENNWTLIPQNVPGWIYDVEPEIKKVLDQKIG